MILFYFFLNWNSYTLEVLLWYNYTGVNTPCTILLILLSKLEQSALVYAFLLAIELWPHKDFLLL